MRAGRFQWFVPRLLAASTLSSQLAAIYGSNLALCLCADENASGSAWTDGSGKGNNFAQATSGQRPTLNTGGQGGKKYLTFISANSQNMTASSFSGLNSGDGVTLFSVIQRGSVGKSIFEVATSTSNTDSCVRQRVIFNGKYMSKAEFATSGTVDCQSADANNTGEVHIFSTFIDTTGHTLNAQQDAGTAGTVACSPDTLNHTAAVGTVGCAIDQSEFWEGDIYAHVLANVNDATKRASAYAVIKAYYGL